VVAALFEQEAELPGGTADFQDAAAVGGHQGGHFGARLVVIVGRAVAGLDGGTGLGGFHPWILDGRMQKQQAAP
jgi:hypothetical protein